MSPLANVWYGRVSLAIACWGLGIGAGVLWALCLSLVTPGSGLAVAALLALTAYYCVINVVVWRAAKRYSGWRGWVWLARAAVVLGFWLVGSVALALGVAAWETFGAEPAPALKFEAPSLQT